jgi:hypothetical protein
MLDHLFKIAKKSKRVSHFITWNLFSTKDTYKRYSMMQSIKELTIKFMENWDYEDHESINSDYKNINQTYESIFQHYLSFDEFVNKNLIVLNPCNAEQFVSGKKLLSKELYPFKLQKSDSIIGKTTTFQKIKTPQIVNGNPNEQFKWRHYASSLNFINDLITISESLKGCAADHRNTILGKFINFINENLLPAEVYIPIPFGLESLNENFEYSENQAILLSIKEEHAFCISTKEKVPYHILLEVSDNYSDPSSATNSGNIKESSPISRYETEFLSEISRSEKQIETPKTVKKSFFSSFFSCCTGGSHEIQEEIEEDNYSINVKNDFPLSLFGHQTFTEISKKLKEKSKFAKKYQNRRILSVFVKGNEDMRTDLFVSQIIDIFISIFEKENLDIFLKPLCIVTNGRGGIIQTLTNTTSLKNINAFEFPGASNNYSSFFRRNSQPTTSSLKNYFDYKFSSSMDKYRKAVQNFLKSLVGYSLLCYALEIKDRNNGNILIDDEGNLIHIDFGFLFSRSPGNMNFEKVPFKFTGEFLEILEGLNSSIFREFQKLFYQGFCAIRKNIWMLTCFVDIYILTNSDLHCFSSGEFISNEIKKKFLIDQDVFEEDIQNFTNELILISLDNWRTKLYDNFQKYCVGVN